MRDRPAMLAHGTAVLWRDMYSHRVNSISDNKHRVSPGNGRVLGIKSMTTGPFEASTLSFPSSYYGMRIVPHFYRNRAAR